jgi:tellurite resistance protein TerA
VTTILQRGANAAATLTTAEVAVAWSGGPGLAADATAYLLSATGRVRSDADMIFFNQPQSADGAVRLQAGQPTRFLIQLGRAPADVAKIVFCLTLDGGRSFADLQACSVELGEAGAAASLRFEPPLAGASEAAMMLAELYRHGGGWKFRAVGQGFNGGLAPLARSFGIDVADEPAPAAPAPAAPAPPPPAPPPPPARPVSLSKVSLEMRGQSVSLEKRGASFGEIRINLNWTRGKRGLFGGGSAVDLDLGCLFELADGRRSVVQALGNVFGAFDRPPFIQLSGDDRTGDVSQGETLRINGARWSELRRVAVFANIYDGVPNWQATDGVVTVVMPDQPVIEVRMTEGRNDRRLCGIVLLENDGGGIRATRIVDYHRDQQDFDRAHGFGLRWTAGSKD